MACRVLFIGHCFTVFVYPLASALRHYDNFQVDVVDLHVPDGAERQPYEQVFNQIIDSKQAYREQYKERGAFGRVLELFLRHNKKERRSFITDRIAVGLGLIDAPVFLKVIRQAKLVKSWLADVDIVHVHSAGPQWYLQILKFLPRDKKIVISIWGSDLYQFAGLSYYRIQLEALNRADLITIHSPEMREVLLAKFGRHLAPKVRFTLIGLDPSKFSQIDSQRSSEARRLFLEKYGIPQNKVIVCVGNSGSPRNRHLSILKCISELEETLRKQMFIVMPMTYTMNVSEYITSVKDAAASMGLEFQVLEDFMSEGEIASLRCATDIFVHLRETDAFSATMIESLYAGAVLITGSWLPYGRLRTNGMHYHEVEEISDLKKLLPHILNDLESEKKKALSQNCQIKNLTSLDHTIKGWVNVYNELTSEITQQVDL